MRKIDDAHDPEDHRQSLGHQGVEPPEDDTVNNNLDEYMQSLSPAALRFVAI